MPRVAPLIESQKVEYRKENLRRKIVRDIADLGIKRKDLAILQGITPGSLSNQLTGRTEISLDTFLAWQILREEKLGSADNEKEF